MALVCSSFHATQRCGSSGLRKCKGLVPIGKGQAITPFCAVSISQTTACFEEDTALQQDLGLKNEGVSSQMLYQWCSRGVCHIPPPKQKHKTIHLQVAKDRFLQTSPVQQKRAAFEKRERIRVTQYSSHIAAI